MHEEYPTGILQDVESTCEKGPEKGSDIFHGEFDPGSELTLVACLSHASRTRKRPSGREYSGERVSNTWVTCLRVGDNPFNEGLIPHNTAVSHEIAVKGGLCLHAAAWRWARGPLVCW